MPMPSRISRHRHLSVVAAVALLAACTPAKREPVSGSDVNDPKLLQHSTSPLFGQDGIVFGGKKNTADGGGGGGIGVNAFLWRGTLDTLAFMPLSSADPFGGVIITDWYQPAGAQGERFKATAYILSRQLRADGLKVSIFRQVLQGGQWVDVPVSPATVADIEDKVLAKARELRAEVVGASN